MQQAAGGVFTGKVELVEPFFAFVLYLWQRVGTSDVWLRMHGVLFGIGTVVLGYMLGNRAGGRRMGASAALLLALGPFLVFYSRDAKEYAMVAFLELLAAYAAILYGSGEGRRVHWVLYVVTATLAVYSHNVVPFFLTALNIMYFTCYARTARKTGWWMAAQAVIIVLSLPWFAAQFRFAHAMENKMFWAPIPTARSLFVTFGNMFTGYVPEDWLRIAGGGFLAALLIAGLLFGGANRRVFIFLVLTAIGQMFGLYLFSRLGKTSYFVDRFLVGNSAIFLTAAGIAIASLPRAWLRWTGVAVSVVLMGLSLHDLYRNRIDDNGFNHVGVYKAYDCRGMSGRIREEWQQGDVVWHVWRQVFSPMRWYARDLRQEIVDMSGRMKVAEAHRAAASAEDIGAEPIEIEKAAEGARRVWFVVPGEAKDMSAMFKGILAWLRVRGGEPKEYRFGGKDDIHAPSEVFLFDLSKSGTPNLGVEREDVRRVEFSRVAVTLTAPAFPGGEATATFENKSDVPQRVFYEAYGADAVCWAQGFERTLAQDSTWRVQPYRDRDQARIAMHKRVDTKSHPADLLLQSTSLPAGTYGVFVERLMMGEIHPTPTADFVVRADEAEFRVPGTGNQLRGGWMWQRAGQWNNTSGGEFAVSVLADDPRHRPEALAIISTVLFVKESAAGPALETPVLSQGALAVPRGQTETVSIPTATDARRLYCVVALPEDCGVTSIDLPRATSP